MQVAAASEQFHRFVEETVAVTRKSDVTVLEIFAERQVEFDAQALDVVVTLLAVIDEGMDHLDGGGIFEDIEADGEREPLAAALHGLVGACDLDHRRDGAAALHLARDDLGLEVVVGDDAVRHAGTVLGLRDQPAAGHDLVSVHGDVVDELVAAFGEGDLEEAVVNDDLVVIIAGHDRGAGHRFGLGEGPQGLLVGLDGVQFQVSGLVGAEGGVEAHPFDAAVRPAGQHPVLLGNDGAVRVGQRESSLLVHRSLGEGDAPALAELVSGGLVDPVQVHGFGVQGGGCRQQCE